MINSVRDDHNRNVDKWVALAMMQQAEQVRNIAEMLCATMEDMSDQMETLNEHLESLSDATETIQEKLDDMMDLMNSEKCPDSPLFR